MSGVQIQFRGQKIEENEDLGMEETHPGLQEAIVKISGFDGISSSSEVRRNEIVENFFADIASETCKTNSTVASEALTQDIRARANGIYDFLVHSRRFLHRHPELMYQEEISSAWVQKVLSDLNIKFTKGWAVNTHPDIIEGPGGYGVVADIGTGDQDETENWKITLIDTGVETMTGGRIKRIEPYTNGESFMLTYGDGLANININTLIKNHISSKSICTVTAVSPPGRFGTLVLDNNNKVSSFEEKKEGKKSLINGGFFVCDNSIFSYIKDDETVFEKTPLENLSLEGKLNAYVHKGFWQPMDTLRDKNQLNSLWSDKKAPWKLWE